MATPAREAAPCRKAAHPALRRSWGSGSEPDSGEREDGLWQEHGLVFPTRIGTPMEPDNLRRSWGRITAAAGLDGVRFHDIRHTCVPLLLDFGVPPHIVREIVGHSDMERWSGAGSNRRPSAFQW